MKHTIILTGFFVLSISMLISFWPKPTRAQAPAGFTKIASVTAQTYTDTTAILGNVYTYEVTATVGTVESVPSLPAFAIMPTNPPTVPVAACNGLMIHCAVLSWVQPTGQAITVGNWNVYRRLTTGADINPPGSLTVTVP